MSLLQSQNKPKQQLKSFIQYKTDIHNWASEVMGCQWVTSATQTLIANAIGGSWQASDPSSDSGTHTCRVTVRHTQRLKSNCMDSNGGSIYDMYLVKGLLQKLYKQIIFNKM